MCNISILFMNSRLQRLWNLKYDTSSHQLRKTSIIGTIGAKSNSVEIINAMRDEGLNILRLKFSMGNHEFFQSVIDNCRESERSDPNRPLGIALDTRGSEIRTGSFFKSSNYYLPLNNEVIFTTDKNYKNCSDDKIIYIDYSDFVRVVEIGQLIFCHDGLLCFKVIKILNNCDIKVQVMTDGYITSNMNVNIPGVDLSTSYLSFEDKEDIIFGLHNSINMIFVSFTNSAKDITNVRNFLGSENSHIKLIAKIETRQAIQNFEEIVRVSDGIMIARGNLAIEIPPEEVFVVQKRIIACCNVIGKAVICASQMLENMTFNPRPTRAEVSDVGNAILDGVDCVMLSTETAVGKYPVETVRTMSSIALIAEEAFPYVTNFDDVKLCTPRPTSSIETIAISAVSAVIEQEAKAIVVLSHSDETARLISKYTPPCPIMFVTCSEQMAKTSHLYHGVFPFILENCSNKDNICEMKINLAFKMGQKFKIFKRMDSIIIVESEENDLNFLSIVEVT